MSCLLVSCAFFSWKYLFLHQMLCIDINIFLKICHTVIDTVRSSYVNWKKQYISLNCIIERMLWSVIYRISSSKLHDFFFLKLVQVFFMLPHLSVSGQQKIATWWFYITLEALMEVDSCGLRMTPSWRRW